MTSETQVEDTLARVELFADLDREDLERLAKASVVRDFQKDDVILKEGETGVAFYVISRGSVDVVKDAGTSSEQHLATLKAGQFFGEMALFDNQLRSASVRAAEGTQCIVLTKWDVNAEMMQNGRIAVAMLSVLARRIRRLNEDPSH
jgi:CRP/FNR family cyclic AMP-dependent transcriptional regulator